MKRQRSRTNEHLARHSAAVIAPRHQRERADDLRARELRAP
jgi:hypothetical protein